MGHVGRYGRLGRGGVLVSMRKPISMGETAVSISDPGWYNQSSEKRLGVKLPSIHCTKASDITQSIVPVKSTRVSQQDFRVILVILLFE